MDQEQLMIGTIQTTNKSQSGKTIGVQINGVWYTTKNWELAQEVGRTIIFEPSTSTFNGQEMHWLNDYVFEDQSATPAAQAMDTAMAGQTTRGGPQVQQPRVVPNKDALIGALALTKSISGQPEQVWEAFVYFYHKMDNFDPTVKL